MYFQFLIEDGSTSILVSHVMEKYKQDAICETWEVLADIVYPKGYLKLKKGAVGNYSEIGDAKCEWADKIGRCLHLHENSSPSYQYFIGELEKRILAS